MLLVIRALIASSLLYDASAQQGDWSSDWSGSTERLLDSAFDVDPLDARSTMRGSGSITLGNGIGKFNGSPRLYISQIAGVAGWGDVEIIAYGKYVDRGAEPYKSYSGLTLVARSNHDNYKTDACDAFGYYARIYQETGECSFQKEYWHGSSTVYTPSNRVNCFSGGLPLGQWVGMKFKVTTQPGTDDVDLELYLDENNAGTWVLKHSLTDTPGYWLSTSSTTVPSECPQSDGDTVVRPGNVCFLRTDGKDTTTEVHWRNVTMTNSLGTTNDGPTSNPTSNPTKAPVTFTVSPTNSPLSPSMIKYLCNRNYQSTSEICASGQPVTPGGMCQSQGDGCGGPKTCWLADCGGGTAGPPPSTTPPPAPLGECVAPSCGCACVDYSGNGDCRGCGCSWEKGNCVPLFV